MALPYWVGHYIGLPFKEHGRDRAGLDCWGLVRLVLAEQFGVFVPSYVGNYASTNDAETLGALVRDESQLWVPIPPGQEKTGDVIVLRMRGQPMHVGLVIVPGEMLHIEKDICAAREKYTSIRWKDRVHGFYGHASGT